MARFNTVFSRKAARGPVRTVGEAGLTYEGARGFARDAKSELFLATVASFNEDSFYETADERLDRIRPLIREIAVGDPEWMRGLVGWLRRDANLRSIPIAVAAETVKARLDAGQAGRNRDIVGAALVRADEPGEFLAYWRGRFGRAVPSPVKRAVADALDRSLTEYAWLKWRGKGARGDFAIADVLNIVHPKPRDERQEALFAAILEERYGRELDADLLAKLPMVRARREFLALDEGAKREWILGGGERVRAAGLTHEVLAGVLGRLDSEVWEALVPTMGYQALLMNLRRIAEAGVSDGVVAAITARLADPDEVEKSRMYPMRFLAAVRNAPLEYAGALEKAANVSVRNVPVLPGRTLVLVDRSGSMWSELSRQGTLRRVDAANVFGAALALRAENADLVAFGTASRVVPYRKGDSLLRLADAPADMGGTDTRGAVERHYRRHDRVVVLTDEQYGFGWQNAGRDVFAGIVPDRVPTFTWNLAGYRLGHADAGPRRWTFGGLTDKGFDLIPLLERGFDGGWPWER